MKLTTDDSSDDGLGVAKELLATCGELTSVCKLALGIAAGLSIDDPRRDALVATIAKAVETLDPNVAMLKRRIEQGL